MNSKDITIEMMRPYSDYWNSKIYSTNHKLFHVNFSKNHKISWKYQQNLSNRNIFCKQISQPNKHKKKVSELCITHFWKMSWKHIQFRTQHVFKGSKERIQWFPGHMMKGLRQMRKCLKETDCVIEVHDARIPFSGRNSTFKNDITGNRPHILVLNKKDLVFGARAKSEGTYQEESVKERILSAEPTLSDVIFTNCKNIRCAGLQSVSAINYYTGHGSL